MASTGPDDTLLLCPSAQPDWEGAVLIGIVEGTADVPMMRHVASPQRVTDELLRLVNPVTPTEVFRFAAPCLCDGCVNFEGSKCHLAAQAVSLLPEAAERMPKCAIRPNCRWWRQEGEAGCLRCQQLVTDNYNPSKLMRRAVMQAAAAEP
jgi:hypothetical protein